MLLPRMPGKKRPGANVDMLDGGKDARDEAAEGPLDKVKAVAYRMIYNAEVEMKGDWNQPTDK